MSELDALDKVVAGLALATDIDSGAVPDGSSRGRTTQEQAAKVNFLAIESDSQRDAGMIAEELMAARLVMQQLLADHLRQEKTTAGRLDRLQELQIRGLAIVDGIPDLINESAERVRMLLTDSAQRAGMRMAQEAGAQGVPISADVSLDAAASAVLDRQASRLAMTPQSDALRALVEGVVLQPSTMSPEDVMATLQREGAELSTAPLSRFARQAVSSATGLARTAVAEGSGQMAEIIASELLDRNTCGPCGQVDGKHYLNFTALRQDYPAGTYVGCLGGPNCRGTPVVIYRPLPSP